MKTVAAVWIIICLLLNFHFGRAEKSTDDSIHTSHIMLFTASPQSLISLLLLVLTAILSGSVYLWILRYICIGCCQPIPVGTESDVLDGVV